MKINNKRSLPKGFSLVEVVVAIGLVALLLAGVLGLMAPASRNIERTLSRSDAKRAADILVKEMNTFRKYTQTGAAGPDDAYASAFDKAFDWMQDSDDVSSLVLVYQYNGLIGETNVSDGTFVRADKSDTSLVQGKDYVVVPIARLKSNSLAQSELAAGFVNGKVFLAKFKGYEKQATGLVLEANYGDVTEYSGLVSAQMELYRLKSNSWSFINGINTAKLGKLGKPVYTTNVAFTR